MLETSTQSITNRKGGRKPLAQMFSETEDLAEFADILRTIPVMYALENSDEDCFSAMGSVTAFNEGSTLSPLCHFSTNSKRLPCAFTSQANAQHYISQIQKVIGPSNLVIRKGSWHAGLYHLLVQGYEGIILDPECDSVFELERPQMAAVYALLNGPQMLRKENVNVIVKDGQVFVHQLGKRKICYIYDTPLASEAGLAWLQRSVDSSIIELGVDGYPLTTIFEKALESGVSLYLINAGLPDQHIYYKEDVFKLLKERGFAKNIILTADKEETPEDSFELREIAEQTPKIEKFRCSTRDDQENLEIFQNWKNLAMKRTIEPWQFLEEVAFNMKFYIPILEKSKSGLHWPQIWRGDDNKYLITGFSRKEDLDEELKVLKLFNRKIQEVSGIEAFRWILATPAPFDEICFDSNDPEGLMQLPGWWGLIPIFPLMIKPLSLDRIADYTLSELSEVPGARALKPEIAKSLINNAALIEEVFSGIQKIRDLGSFMPVRKGNGDSIYSSHAPFLRLIDKTKNHDGIAFDALGKTPLIINRHELIILHAWHESKELFGSRDTLINETKKLLSRGHINSHDAAGVVSEIPRYWIGIKKGKKEDYIKDPKTGHYVFFTSEELLDKYLQKYPSTFKEVRITSVLSGWQNTAFHHAAKNETGVSINPGSSKGLELDLDAVNHASLLLDKKLQPRIDHFFA